MYYLKFISVCAAAIVHLFAASFDQVSFKLIDLKKITQCQNILKYSERTWDKDTKKDNLFLKYARVAPSCHLVKILSFQFWTEEQEGFLITSSDERGGRLRHAWDEHTKASKGCLDSLRSVDKLHSSITMRFRQGRVSSHTMRCQLGEPGDKGARRRVRHQNTELNPEVSGKITLWHLVMLYIRLW